MKKNVEDFLEQTNQGKLFTANIMSGKRVQYCYRANKALVMLAGSSKVGRKYNNCTFGSINTWLPDWLLQEEGVTKTYDLSTHTQN